MDRWHPHTFSDLHRESPSLLQGTTPRSEFLDAYLPQRALLEGAKGGEDECQAVLPGKRKKQNVSGIS